VHHWKSKTKDENLSQSALLQDLAAAFGLVESEAQQQDDKRAEVERMLHKWSGSSAIPIRGISYDSFAASRRSDLFEKVALKIERVSVIREIGSDN
jgi:hypothetical protein